MFFCFDEILFVKTAILTKSISSKKHKANRPAELLPDNWKNLQRQIFFCATVTLITGGVLSIRQRDNNFLHCFSTFAIFARIFTIFSIRIL
jgi:hypothetical protein